MERAVFVLAGGHVAKHDAVAAQQVLERPQAQVVEVRVQAAVFREVHVAQRVQSVDLHGELAEHVLERGELVAHEAGVVRVGPEHLWPVVEALAPRARVAREARRQRGALPAVVHEASARCAAGRVEQRLELVVREERGRAARPAGRVVFGERAGSRDCRNGFLVWFKHFEELFLKLLVALRVLYVACLYSQELVIEQENAHDGQAS